MKKSKSLLVVNIILTVLLCLFIGLFFFAKNNLKPVDKNSLETEIFTIDAGSSAKAVFEKLEDEGLIKNSMVAYYYSRFLHNADFKAGVYEISKSMSVEEIIDYLSDGNNAIQDTVIVKFPEGEWLKYFAQTLDDNTNLDAGELMTYWNDENVIREFMKDYEFLTEEIFNPNIRYPLEGYFFPDTYEFYANTTMEAVTRKMLDRTNEIYQKYKADFDKSEFSIHEIFTLASLLQFESGSHDDMLKIASVFINRLNIGMPLQSSVSICYAIDIDIKTDDWRKCELSSNQDNESPYNTYKYNGLPPGPIVSPGEDAIEVALHPADTNYYYFVVDMCKNPGYVYFSETYAEQLAVYPEYLGCLQ